MESRRWNSLPQWRSPVGANVLLGVWLVVSTFAFHQTFDDALVTWILGALIAICSAGELVAPDLRYLDAMLAVLLGIAALVLPATSRITQVNQLCVAAAVLVFSLLSGGGGPRERRIRRGRTSAEFPL